MEGDTGRGRWLDARAAVRGSCGPEGAQAGLPPAREQAQTGCATEGGAVNVPA